MTLELNKKKYITLRDRVWKGKEWWSSFRRQVYIRTLTQEEANTLDDIQEYVPKLKPLEENIIDCKDSRLSCKKCKSTKGFYVYNFRRGEQKKWFRIYTCADCKSREKKYNQ